MKDWLLKMQNTDKHLLLWYVAVFLFLGVQTFSWFGIDIDIKQVSLNFIVILLLLISIQLKDIYIELEENYD